MQRPDGRYREMSRIELYCPQLLQVVLTFFRLGWLRSPKLSYYEKIVVGIYLAIAICLGTMLTAMVLWVMIVGFVAIVWIVVVLLLLVPLIIYIGKRSR